MPRTFIHIGFPKTASSFLQLRIFSGHPDIAYLGIRGGNTEFDATIRNQINRTDSLTYDRDQVLATLQTRRAEVGQKPVEILSSQGFSTTVRTDRGLVATRLKELFPDAHILVCVRNQFDWISSLYYEHKKQGNWRLVAPFRIPGGNHVGLSLDQWFDHRMKTEEFFPLLRDLNYWPLISLYRDLFGNNKVHVVLYEDLQANQHKFVQKISDIMNIDASEFGEGAKSDVVNPRVNTADLAIEALKERYRYLDWIRKLTPRTFKDALRQNLRTRTSSRYETLRDDQTELIKERCGAGNRYLNDLFGLNMGDKGYPI